MIYNNTHPRQQSRLKRYDGNGEETCGNGDMILHKLDVNTTDTSCDHLRRF